MDKVLYVSPQNYLLNRKEWLSSNFKVGYISIFERDLARFEDCLNNYKCGLNTFESIKSLSSENRRQASKDEKDEEYSLSNDTSMENDTKYMSLKVFFTTSAKDQLYTISLRNLKYNKSIKGIDTFIHGIIALIPYAGNEKLILSCWSRVYSTEMDRQDLFLRFNHEKTAEPVFDRSIKFLKEIGLKTKLFSLHSEKCVGKYISISNLNRDANVDDKSLQKFKILVDKFLNDPTSLQKNEILNTSTEYQINLDTLSDLPRESLEQLSKDITEFRLRVINIEKLKLLKENNLENKRRRTKMKEVFESIKRVEGNDKVVLSEHSSSEEYPESESDDDSAGNERIFESNYDVEKRLNKVKIKESIERYKILLSKLNFSIDPRIQTIRKELDKAMKYEQFLKDNKAMYMKSFLHEAKDIYCEPNRPFKDEEIILDQINREKFKNSDLNDGADDYNEYNSVKDVEHFVQNDIYPKEINIKLAIKKPNDMIYESENIESTEKRNKDILYTSIVDAETEGDILFFDADELNKRLRKLQESRTIDELVKEYLGVYESELVDYILDNIRNNRSKKMLLNELTETFDTDAAFIVNKIWESKELQ